VDYLVGVGNNGDRIPPKWCGWLSYTYDDVPVYGANEFVDPFYQKPHTWMYNPRNMFIPRFSVMHAENTRFVTERRERYAQEWDGSGQIGVRGGLDKSTTVNTTKQNVVTST
jgi:NADH:ubiquinone oxidoreductase subunit